MLFDKLSPCPTGLWTVFLVSPPNLCFMSVRFLVASKLKVGGESSLLSVVEEEQKPSRRNTVEKILG